MEKRTTHRIIGLVVLIALAVIVMPLLFNGNHPTTQTAAVKAPPFPDQDEQTTPTQQPTPPQTEANAASNNNPTQALPNTLDANPATTSPDLAANNNPEAANQNAQEDPLHPALLTADNNPQSFNAAQNIDNGAASSSQPMTAPMPANPSPQSNNMPNQQDMQPGMQQPNQSPMPGQPMNPNQQGMQPGTPPNSSSLPPSQPMQQPTPPLSPNQPVRPNQAMPPQPMQPGPVMPGPANPQQMPQQPSQGLQPIKAPVGPGADNTTTTTNPSAVSQVVAIDNKGKASSVDTVAPTPVAATPAPAAPIVTASTATPNVNAEAVLPPTTAKKIKTSHKNPKKHIMHQAKHTHNSMQQLRQAAWVVQMGSFHNKGNAERLVNTLRAKGFKAFTRQVKTSTRVYVGPEFKQAEAKTLSDQIQQTINMHGIVVTYHPLEL